MDPFLQLFRHTANLLLPPASAPQGADGKGLVGQLTLLLEIYYDFTCQDLPPAIEDGHEEFFGPEQGWFVRILSWEAGALGQEDDEEKAGVVSLLKTRVLEIAEVCSDLSYFSFPFTKSSYLPMDYFFNSSIIPTSHLYISFYFPSMYGLPQCTPRYTSSVTHPILSRPPTIVFQSLHKNTPNQYSFILLHCLFSIHIPF